VKIEALSSIRQSGGGPWAQSCWIEDPPIVAPPDNLKHLHFNDRMLYFISKN
jgi:hypothetical protein